MHALGLRGRIVEIPLIVQERVRVAVKPATALVQMVRATHNNDLAT